MNSLKAQVDALSQEKESLSERVKDLDTANSTQLQAVEVLKKELKGSQNSLKSKAAELEKAKATSKGLHVELQNVKDENTRLDNMYKTLQDQHVSLNAEHDELKKSHDDRGVEVERLSRELETSNDYTQRLKAETEKAKASLDKTIKKFKADWRSREDKHRAALRYEEEEATLKTTYKLFKQFKGGLTSTWEVDRTIEEYEEMYGGLDEDASEATVNRPYSPLPQDASSGDYLAPSVGPSAPTPAVPITTLPPEAPVSVPLPVDEGVGEAEEGQAPLPAAEEAEGSQA